LAAIDSAVAGAAVFLRLLTVLAFILAVEVFDFVFRLVFFLGFDFSLGLLALALLAFVFFAFTFFAIAFYSGL